MPLDQTRRGGGNVPATVLVVHRKFQVLLMASVDEAGTRETRTPYAHERAAAAAAARAQQVCVFLLCEQLAANSSVEHAQIAACGAIACFSSCSRSRSTCRSHSTPALAMQAEADALAAAEAEDLAHCQKVLAEGTADGGPDTQSKHDTVLLKRVVFAVRSHMMPRPCTSLLNLILQVSAIAEERVYAEAIVYGGGEPELVTQAVDRQLETARCAGLLMSIISQNLMSLRQTLCPKTCGGAIIVCQCIVGFQRQAVRTHNRSAAICCAAGTCKSGGAGCESARWSSCVSARRHWLRLRTVYQRSTSSSLGQLDTRCATFPS